MKQSVKNGKIEFLRFVFCMTVLFYHTLKYTKGVPTCGEGISISLFPHGALGVEFFFLLTGLLMAKSAYKQSQKPAATTELGTETFSFLLRKIKALWPYHLIAFFAIYVETVVLNKMNLFLAIKLFFRSLPNLFMIHKSGIEFTNLNYVEWYLSAMFIVLIILYPLCRRYYNMFTHVIAPFGVLMIAGYMQHVYGSLCGVSVWTGLCYKSILRAAMEIALGAVCFEVSRYISDLNITRQKMVLLSAVEYVCYILALGYMASTADGNYEIYVLFLFVVALPISFSNLTIGSDFFNKKLFYFLGKLSLPIYVMQVFAFTISNILLVDMSNKVRALSILVITFVSALLCLFFGDKMKLMNSAERTSKSL